MLKVVLSIMNIKQWIIHSLKIFVDLGETDPRKLSFKDKGLVFDMHWAYCGYKNGSDQFYLGC